MIAARAARGVRKEGAAAREYRGSPHHEEEPLANTSRGSGLAQELRELASLRDDGILTDDEFQAQKRKLLEQLGTSTAS
jgi:hypothetical protein